MYIKGFQKLTLLDFPGHTACTVFTGGCNLRCPFCHNAGLVKDMDDDFFEEEEIFEHLKKRKGVLDGVAITGGEPLLQKDIERFLYEIKCEGYPIKLDTNGTYPERLKDILDLDLVEYVAVDIKNCKEKYGKTVGVENFDITPIEKTVEILKNSNIDYEFRTTVVDGFHTVEDIEKITEWIKGAPHYFLQNFVDSGNLLDSSCKGVSKETMREMEKAAQKTIPNAAVRGI